VSVQAGEPFRQGVKILSHGGRIYTDIEKLSTQILTQGDKILSMASGRLGDTMRRRLPVKEVLARKLKETSTNPEEVARRATDKGYKIAASTIKQILNGSTKNPQVFSLEAIAVGMGVSPLAFIAEILGDKSEELNFKGSQFAVLLEAYKEIPLAHRPKADPFVDGFLLQLRHIKSQAR